MAGIITHAGALGMAAATTGALAVHASRQRTVPGSRPFAWLLGAFTAYSVLHLLGLLTAAPAVRRLLEYLQWTAAMAVPVAWLAFAAAYTGHDEFVERRGLATVAVVPAGAAALGWTNQLHGLVWAVNRPTTVDGLTILVQTFGPVHWVAVAYAYACIVGGGSLLVRHALASEGLYTGQTLLLAVALAVPLVGNLLSVLRVLPATRLDLTPYTFAVSGLVFAHAVFRYRLLDLVPGVRTIGRRSAVDALEEGIVVLDDDRRVVSLNRAATELLDRDREGLVGEQFDEVLDLPPDIVALEDPIAVTDDDRTFEVRASTVTDARDHQLGHTLVLDEVTERTRQSRELRRKRDELDTYQHVTAVVRAINRALVGSRSRDGVLSTVCDRLVDSGLYAAAWAVDETGTVTAEAGDPPQVLPDHQEKVAFGDGGASDLGDGALEGDATGTFDDGDATGTLGDGDETGSLGDGDATGSLDGADWTSVPLVYGRSAYGRLLLTTARQGGFEEQELAVLEEMGGLIGHALAAAEKRSRLVADTVLELELSVPADEEVLCALAEQAGVPLALRGVVPAGEGILAYLNPEGTTDGVRDATGMGAVDGVRVLDTDAPASPLEVQLAGGSVLPALCESGATVSELRATDQRCRLVVAVAPDVDVRALVDRLAADVPGVELHSRRERAVEELDDLERDLVEELTDRQQQALRTAYAAGYFDWPRASTAEEVADAMDIAPPTLHSHLRKAQRKLLAEVLETTPDDG